MEAKEKECIVMFDEVKLKKGLDLNKHFDFLEGYEDFAEHGRNAVLADSALVFYVRGMLFGWKLPFCYYLSKGPVKGQMLEKIIRNIIMKLHQISLCPRVIVADQGLNNRNAFKRLGATKENPVVMINEKEILFMFDTSHLLKSLRNNLMNKKVDIIIDGIKINWEYFEKTCIIHKRSSMGNGKDYANTFEKMRVRYAVQLFSNSVCAAIITAVAINELNSKTAKENNNIFDCLNSRSLKDSNRYRQGLSIYNKLPYITLVDALEYFKKIEVFDEGFQWTIKAVLIRWDNLQEEGVKYSLTSCLNQDSLEKLFSVIRNRSDCNEDCNSIEATFQSLDSSQENLAQCSQPLGNSDDTCRDTEDTDLLITEIKAAQEYFSSALESDNEENPFTLESCSVAYIAGYLGKFLMDKVNCPCTAENVPLDAMDLSHADTLIFHREFGNEEDIRHLKKPTDIFFSVIKSLLSVFDTLFEQVKTDHGMGSKKKRKTYKIPEKVDEPKMGKGLEGKAELGNHMFSLKDFA
nr:unnamed protein product [Callosobruchus analis]